MKSPGFPSPDEVLDTLGSTFVHAVVDAVDGARSDYAALKEWHSDWAPSYSSRFIANFTHERIWARLIRQVDGAPSVEICDREPVREIRIGTTYVARVKRHHRDDRISAYPTPGSLAYWSNSSRAIALEGLEQLSLAVGYYWDVETREIGDSVLSLREEQDKPLWGVVLERSVSAPSSITWHSVDPGLPEFDLSQIAADEDKEEGLA